MKRIASLGIVMMILAVSAMQAKSKHDREFEAYKATLPEPNANYGSYPENYQELIKTDLMKRLKDPDSAKFSEFTIPRKEHAIENLKAIYGYSSCVLVNAKNSFGGYTGNHLFWFFYQNGKIIRSHDTTTGFKIIYIGHPINCENGNN